MVKLLPRALFVRSCLRKTRGHFGLRVVHGNLFMKQKMFANVTYTFLRPVAELHSVNLKATPRVQNHDLATWRSAKRLTAKMLDPFRGPNFRRLVSFVSEHNFVTKYSFRVVFKIIYFFRSKISANNNVMWFDLSNYSHNAESPTSGKIMQQFATFCRIQQNDFVDLKTLQHECFFRKERCRYSQHRGNNLPKCSTKCGEH